MVRIIEGGGEGPQVSPNKHFPKGIWTFPPSFFLERLEILLLTFPSIFFFFFHDNMRVFFLLSRKHVARDPVGGVAGRC